MAEKQAAEEATPVPVQAAIIVVIEPTEAKEHQEPQEPQAEPQEPQEPQAEPQGEPQQAHQEDQEAKREEAVAPNPKRARRLIGIETAPSRVAARSDENEDIDSGLPSAPDMLMTPKLAVGAILNNRWKLQKKIGQGGYGAVYLAVEVDEKGEPITNTEVALKTMNDLPWLLYQEGDILRRLQSSPFVCRLLDEGDSHGHAYMAMELQGRSLYSVYRRQRSMHMTLKLGVAMIRAVQSVHELGYVHRDIKPDNFLLGRDAKLDRVYLIDFGIAKLHLRKDGTPFPPNKAIHCFGHPCYASLSALRGNDSGRCDDMWSLFYVLVEMAKGKLPWDELEEEEAIAKAKEERMKPELVEGLPVEFLRFMEHLNSLTYWDRPDYDYLVQLFQSRIAEIERARAEAQRKKEEEEEKNVPVQREEAQRTKEEEEKNVPVQREEGPKRRALCHIL